MIESPNLFIWKYKNWHNSSVGMIRKLNSFYGGVQIYCIIRKMVMLCIYFCLFQLRHLCYNKVKKYFNVFAGKAAILEIETKSFSESGEILCLNR